ncbi:MAG: hypothetical protein NOU37_06600 [Candidatus Brocadiales bacterium]|nr:hypothetical protein [Candidatus Bathyanammoxibius sp.]MCQ4574903.1 hypothetical protein [Candidatus Bathyanammoxibius amoris]
MEKVLRVGFVKFIIMLLVTWLTLFPGLGNLIFLWASPYYRIGAITALVIALGSSLAMWLLAGDSIFDIRYIILFIVIIAMKIWMTLDAVSAYER